MFSIRLQQLFYVCDRIIIRNVRNSRITYPCTDPGLRRRVKGFRKDGLKVDDYDAEEFIEASESDFANLGEAYNEHLNETLMGKYALSHHIVKDKYFKENMPNLLTWSEKEQIRHLVATDPDEWTPEKIAESFPVTAPVVKKLIKYPWKPATEHRIARHDASVMRNWRELKEGSLSISNELKKHFLKFSDRTIPPLNTKSIKIDITREQKMGEFESIVRKCATKDSGGDENGQHTAIGEETNTQEKSFKKKDSKRMTLTALTEKIQNRLDSGKNVDMNDEIIINSTQNSNKVVQTAENDYEIEIYNSNEDSKELTAFKSEGKHEKSIMDYPERIRIPKKAYKKNATYKVNDCYYDHDGKFLYRVLGISNNN